MLYKSVAGRFQINEKNTRFTAFSRFKKIHIYPPPPNKLFGFAIISGVVQRGVEETRSPWLRHCLLAVLGGPLGTLWRSGFWTAVRTLSTPDLQYLYIFLSYFLSLFLTFFFVFYLCFLLFFLFFFISFFFRFFSFFFFFHSFFLYFFLSSGIYSFTTYLCTVINLENYFKYFDGGRTSRL